MLTLNIEFPGTTDKHVQCELWVTMTLYRAGEEYYSLTKLHCWLGSEERKKKLIFMYLGRDHPGKKNREKAKLEYDEDFIPHAQIFPERFWTDPEMEKHFRMVILPSLELFVNFFPPEVKSLGGARGFIGEESVFLWVLFGLHGAPGINRRSLLRDLYPTSLWSLRGSLQRQGWGC